MHDLLSIVPQPREVPDPDGLDPSDSTHIESGIAELLK